MSESISNKAARVDVLFSSIESLTVCAICESNKNDQGAMLIAIESMAQAGQRIAGEIEAAAIQSADNGGYIHLEGKHSDVSNAEVRRG